MIHTMPDKTVRVTARYPKGHGTVYFDLAKANGFTLEADRYDPDTLVLKAVGCYNDCTAHYGDAAEAETDLADLSLMLADRHSLPAAPPVPALASTQPPLVLGRAKRRGWGLERHDGRAGPWRVGRGRRDPHARDEHRRGRSRVARRERGPRVAA